MADEEDIKTNNTMDIIQVNRPLLENSLANRCQEFLLSQYKGKSWRTKRNAQGILDEFEIFVGNRKIDRLLLLQWDDAQEKRGLSASSINRKTMTIRRFFRWCGEAGYMKDPPISAVVKHQEKRGPIPLIFTDEEYERIKEATKGTHNYFLTIIARNTGMSLVDVCHLRWTCVDLDHLTILTNRIKTSWRGLDICHIPILANSDLHLLLQECKNRHINRYNNGNDDWVNPDLQGWYQFSQHDVTQSYSRMLVRLGITRRSFKNWRNTFISMLANSGMNLALACKITGHKDPSIFAAYIRPDMDAIRTGVQSAFQWQAGKETVKELRKPNP